MTHAQDRTKTALAVLGKPDRNFLYSMGRLEIPYLSLSFKELDLIDEAQRQMPDDLDPDEIIDFLKARRHAETMLAHAMLERRFPDRAPTFDEVYATVNHADLWHWVQDLANGGKGEAIGATAEAPPER
ncbi:hypothetical protein Dxin01_02769 [Deinococcus xinjiangensis]|uniref:Uncharacterized protein n=1 Tax=Deinococcus xinjiangensis TaxID=457454 RepID=A0ABP9VEN1_9DEIO